jgi:predicted RNA binding protein YcfA (HicA-like mRNA interferase family)
MRTREVEKLLIRDGWYHDSTRGSHKQFKHPSKPGKVTIPQHKGDLDINTVNSILRQAGLK